MNDKMAEDHFEQYYTEKIWEMIPAIYRHEDGIGDNPGVLRAIVEVIASQATILRRSQDRLWEDQFIDLCDSWSVPYIGDLVATRLLSDLNRRGQRVDVAKTIYYRRRKGTLRVLEELISDITSWEGKVVENFLRLGRARHRLDPQPEPLAGRFSGTLPGGWADLRQSSTSELSGGPFDEYYHTPDIRRHRGQLGRYGIPKLAIHLYRLKAYTVTGVTPFAAGDDQRFTFDPSGRDIPLFNERNRIDDWDEWRSALEWEMPLPIRCRLLGHAEYRLSEAAVQELATSAGLSTDTVTFLRNLGVWEFKDGTLMRATLLDMAGTAPAVVATELSDPAFFPLLLIHTIIEQCGKQALLPNRLIKDQSGQVDPEHGAITVFQPTPLQIFTAEQIVAANLHNWNLSPAYLGRVFGTLGARELAIDAEKGRFMFADGSWTDPFVNYCYGFSGPIGAGTYFRRVVEDSQPTLEITGGGNALSALTNLGVYQINDSKTYSPVPNKLAIEDLTIQAANLQRPYLQLNRNWRLRAKLNNDACLCLDGLWIGNRSDQQYDIRIQRNYKCVMIRNCTIDPGDTAKNILAEAIHPVRLTIEGSIDELYIIGSITGSILTQGGGLIEKVFITDSIIQSLDTSIAAIELGSGLLDIKRSTVMGAVNCHQLQASEVIITQKSMVTNVQAGCFRFSAAPAESRLPRPYESYLFPENENRWFNATRFGQPAYAQLSETTPAQVQRGAENGSEMGAFNSLLNPIKLDDLNTKIQEYMPFGLIPIFITET